MGTREIQQLALRLSAFTDALEQRARHMADTMERNGQSMAHSAQGIDAQIRQLSQRVVSTVRTESRGAMENGVREGIGPGVAQLEQIVRSAQNASQVLHAQTKALQATHRAVVWLSGAALLIGSMLAAGGSSYLVWKNHQELQRAEFGRDILDATRSGTLNRCGKALCARVGKTPERYGKNGEYVLVK
ncbi:hypothetical protein EBB59_08985 [Lysobacter pythonis]|uniref:Relaxation protein n=1 Tax=Solilutibacter pythonis TaxID=2483112 RepID=A0A3M2HYJ2_9GAMM|nr:hypothetical protein [Lysobacter pythonis]RMH90904.1 hypothetical protein EBB59_08985 [Lysobacter pythonis]